MAKKFEHPKKGFQKSEENRPKKGFLQISNEIQEEFVNTIAQQMIELADGKAWRQTWKVAGLPYCALTNRPYSGGNLVLLWLTSMVKGYNDNRWLTFKQLQEFAKDMENVHVRKGEHATPLLWPEEYFFKIVKENPDDPEERGVFTFVRASEMKEYMRENDGKLPEGVRRGIAFKTFRVFNAAQIENFPEREVKEMEEGERNAFVDTFIASSGVEVVHGDYNPAFLVNKNVIQLPRPGDFEDAEEYYAAKLHEFFHATGHKDREDRLVQGDQSAYALEEMRAELFSIAAGSMLSLPFHADNAAAYIGHWNQKFSGGEAKAVFKVVSDVAKILGYLGQYQNDEQPSAKWFPKKEEWDRLVAAQEERDRVKPREKTKMRM